MDAFSLAVKRPGLVLIFALLAAAPAIVCRAGDGTTLCRWQRTWNGPNSNWRPLRPYYVPRPADPCLYGGYYGHGGFAGDCGGAIEGGYFAEGAVEYERGESAGYGELPTIPVGMERLGRIPNDLGIAGGAAPVTGRPGR